MQGYYRFPSIYKDHIVFVSEDDLWIVSVNGGIARRLTSNLSAVSDPRFSPDGKYIAFTGREEGHPEVYITPSDGGVAKRLTFMGAITSVAGWTPDSNHIILASNHGQWYRRMFFLYSNRLTNSRPVKLPFGAANQISFSTKKGVVIGRNAYDPARWKRYRGGTVGELWIDRNGNGKFEKLLRIKGNMASPMWIKNRIYFISDHEGVGNIYSSTTQGTNVKRHTDHIDFYVRNATTDGQRIVYHAGGDIFMHDPSTGKKRKIDINYHSPRIQTQRKYVDASGYLEDYSIHPKADQISVTSRGQVFSFPNWHGPVTKHGNKPKARYRLGRWLHDGSHFVFISDEAGEDGLHVQDRSSSKSKILKLDIGRPVEIEPSPTRPLIALTNHRFELIIVSIKRSRRTILDQSQFRRIGDITWSPDGEWLAYTYYLNNYFTSCIKIANIATGKTYEVTRMVAQDFSPSFDPQGRYLYLLSNRHFDPVYDKLHFDLGFPANTKAFAVLLRKDIASPFDYTRNAPAGIDINMADHKQKSSNKPKKILIDLEGIKDRIIQFPLPHGIYMQIHGLKDKILYTTFPILGGKEQWGFDGPKAKGILHYYDLNEQKSHFVTSGLLDFKVADQDEIIIYRTKDQVRIAKAIEKLDQKLESQPAGPKSGWIDLKRIKLLIEPTIEWQQMYRDVWRLQRDHFWNRNMSGINWKKIYERYKPLLLRIGSRAEFSDLIWEMQGELCTSHAYEWGGDYRPQPPYKQGFLGAELKYESRRDAWRIIRIISGDPWEKDASSPLLAPGVNVKNGDYLIAINGESVNGDRSPAELLINHAGTDVSLTIMPAKGKRFRNVTVKTLADESLARYRNWVETNRDKVHRLSRNQIGYVHIPDMMPFGFAEFIRYYMAEFSYRGLIVDARFNGGGHVSELVLSYLTKKRIGYSISRWGNPEPYPSESVLGPMVALTNEHAGSDGDIFSHSFKLFKLGTLIGKRTWGGVIGISPYYNLADGGLTTQPEYSFWFSDVGWGVENYGTDPDIEVEIKPEEYTQDKDPQLMSGIKECLQLIKKHKPQLPAFGKRPNLALPDDLP